MMIKWLGHPVFKIISDEGTVVYIDPFIKDNPACPITMDDISKADVIAATHGHRDHLGDTFEIIKKTGALLISSPEICFYAQKHGIKGGEGSYSINIGGYTTFKDISFHGVHAVHTAAIYGAEWFNHKEMIPNGTSMGFVLELRGGKTIYYAGDTGLTMDMQLIGEIYRPDIAILPIGGRFTMTPRLAARAAAMVGAKYVIPMHYNTFPFNQQDPAELQEMIDILTTGIRVIILKPGEEFQF